LGPSGVRRGVAVPFHGAISYAAAKVAGDGSQKLPVRVMPTAGHRLRGGHSARLSAVVVAAWVATLRGPRAGVCGVSDPASDRWMSAAVSSRAGSARAVVEALLRMPGFVGQTSAGFIDEVAAAAERLWVGDVRAVLSGALDERRDP
jgi:mannitol-1-phosphate/altronate dehydrogenase